MSELQDLLKEPPPVRRYYIGNDRLAFYKVGESWVLSARGSFGLIHLASWRWWEPLKQFPRALIAARKVAKP